VAKLAAMTLRWATTEMTDLAPAMFHGDASSTLDLVECQESGFRAETDRCCLAHVTARSEEDVGNAIAEDGSGDASVTGET
jgi:hypothetical protein